jgi:hypothetical protein
LEEEQMAGTEGNYEGGGLAGGQTKTATDSTLWWNGSLQKFPTMSCHTGLFAA